MPPVPLVCLIVADTTLPGADRTVANVMAIGDWVAAATPGITCAFFSVVTFEEVVSHRGVEVHVGRRL